MKNKNIQLTLVILFSWLLVFTGSAQNKKNSTQKKVEITEINATVTNEQGEAIQNATVTVSEGALIYYTDKNGRFVVKIKKGSTIVIEATGYEPNVISNSSTAGNSKIVLAKAPLLAGIKDQLELPGWLKTNKRYNIGAVSKIYGTNIESYPDMVLSNSLQGKLTGLTAIMTAGGLANNPSTLYIRGLHRETGNGIVTIVDGVERDINMLNAEEIAVIEILKDASTKILYGPRAANGVLLITTKRGEKHKRIIKTNAEYGYGLFENTPSYLNSYDYARLYNEARINDGMSPLYSAANLEGYRNSTGVNDFRYPNVDYYNYFLRKNTGYRKANLEFSGGNESTQYAFLAGYNGNSGLQSIGEIPQRDRFTARGNLDMKVNDYISAFLGIAGTFDITKRGALDHTQTFTALSTTRPNEYPFVISEQYIQPDSVGFPNMGTGLTSINNLYGSLLYGGYQKDQNINGQLNFGLKFDFDKLLKGLTGMAQLTSDNYFFGSEGVSSTTALYSQRWIQTSNGLDTVLLSMQRKALRGDDLILKNDNTYRTTSVLGTLNYNNKFNEDNLLKVDYLYNYYLAEATGTAQDLKFANNVISLNWINKKKYITEFNLGYMGSNKFYGKNQFSLSYTGGLGWIISEESFMSGVKNIDYLKVKATAGVLSYDGQTGYNLYRDRWNDNGTVRINNTLEPLRTNFSQAGNPDLKWEKSREINIGIEGLFLHKKLWLEANYFNEIRYDIIENVDASVPTMYGGIYPYRNWGKVKNSGIELELKYSDRAGKLFYQVGGNLIFSKNKVLRTDEINNLYSYLNKTGQPSDALFGYVSEGLFGKDIDITTHTSQYFGSYQNGDIAYSDLNADSKVNELDRQVIGNSFPRTQISLDLTLEYKGFGLYVLGTSQLGYNNLLNSTYYWMQGEGKYSTLALDRYHPTDNPTGTYPRLTTSSGTNNFQNSTFWQQTGDFFRLKNMEVNYTFEPKNVDFLRKIKIFTRGTNLLQFSSNNNFDVEAMNAGITNYPILKTVTAGLSVTF